MPRGLVAITGAGISVGSGLCTFEGSKKDWRAVLDRKYANANWDKYCKEYKEFITPIQKAEPNDAHIALAERDIPIITANIDCLHERAGSKIVHAIHGTCETGDPELDTVILYGDTLPPAYFKAEALVESTCADLVVIGTSLHTNSLQQLVDEYRRVNDESIRIFVINDKSEVNVRKFLHEYYTDGDPYKYATHYSIY